MVDEPILETYARLTNEGKMPIGLFSTRKACETVNEKVLSTLDSDIVELHSSDVIDEHSSHTAWNKKANKRLEEMNKDSNKTAGLQFVLHLAVGARVML